MRIVCVCSALLATAASALLAVDPVSEWRDWPPDPQWAEQRPWAEAPRVIPRAMFAALDSNYDFSLSREEAAASPPVEANFGPADLDRNGRLTPLEFNNIALALAAD